MSNSLEHAGAILTIHLDAIRANYRLLRHRLPGAECPPVVQADAHVLGVAAVPPVPVALAGGRVAVWGAGAWAAARWAAGAAVPFWLPVRVFPPASASASAAGRW